MNDIGCIGPGTQTGRILLGFDGGTTAGDEFRGRHAVLVIEISKEVPVIAAAHGAGRFDAVIPPDLLPVQPQPECLDLIGSADGMP